MDETTIVEHLKPLTGLQFSVARRAADMLVLHFSDIRHVERGSAGAFALHVQCPWRIEGPEGIVTGRLDLMLLMKMMEMLKILLMKRNMLRVNGEVQHASSEYHVAKRNTVTPDEWSQRVGGRRLIDHNNLEEFADPVNYDRQDTSDTGIAFYTALAQETGGPVLEIACGTGRVAIPIARLGFGITGLDIVPGMLEQARRKSIGLPARWVEGDARTFDLGEQFRLIFLTGNAFQAFLTNADQAALLQRVRTHLHDEGLFAFETRNPLFPNTKTRAGFFVPLETDNEEEHWPSFINANGYEVRVSTTRVYDHVAQIVHLTSYKRWHAGEEEHTKVTRTALRYTFPQELAALLHYNGFSIIRQYGDWHGEPLTAASPSIIVVCRKRAYGSANSV